MAASDQFYRSQRTLDIVFAISSLLMLGSIVWMFGQDYYRPYKNEQRAFREVEVVMNQHIALKTLPDVEEIERTEAEVKAAAEERKKKDTEVSKVQKEIDAIKPGREQ